MCFKPRRVSSPRFSDKALPDEDVQGKIRDHKLITGSTQRFSSRLRSIIMRNTSVSCCEGMASGQTSARHTRGGGEKMKVLLFFFFSCPSFALISPEPDDSTGDADWRERGPCVCVCVCQKLGDERTKYGKNLPHMNKSLGDVRARSPRRGGPPSESTREWISLPNLL